MPISCDPNDLANASRCFCGFNKAEARSVDIYLLCQWANHLTPPAPPFHWEPEAQIAEWRDVNGIHFTDWPTFEANAVMNTVWFIDLSGGFPGVTAVTNISSLTALTYLAVSNNPLVALDPTNATLQTLLASNCTLTGLDASGCPSLTNIDVSLCGPAFTSLNVSGLTNLTSIICDNDGLVTLDCTNLIALTTLSCPSNPSLTTLTLTGCTALTDLDCSSCGLASLSCSGLASLTNFNASNNTGPMTSLDFTNCTSLASLHVQLANGYGSLTTLSCSGCTAMTLIDCSSNAINSLTLTNCAALANLDATSNLLSTITDFSDCVGLTNLGLGSNSFATLDCHLFTSLIVVNCDNNVLTALNVTNCSSLVALDASFNQLTTLAVITCLALNDIYLQHNNLTVLAVNTILSDLVTNGTTGGDGNLSGQTPLAPPSVGPPDGITALATLLGYGTPWTMITD